VNDRIRVLHVIQNLNYGGMERLFADIVRLLDRDRFESQVMVLGYLGRYGEGLDRFATIQHAVPMGRASMLRPAALARQIRGIAPAVVHTHAGVWYKVSLAARMAGVPWMVHTEHGRQHPDPLLARLVGRIAARRTDVVVAVSQALADHLRAAVVGPETRLNVVRNGVDTDLYHPESDNGVIRAELGLDRDTPILGSIGRLEYIKGYDIVIRAFGALCRSWGDRPRPALILAGDGAERTALESLAQMEGVHGEVRFLGWRDDVRDLQRGFTLFTMGSRSEGTSVSLLEAMSSGLCPVVTDVGGNAAVLGSSLQHRLVPPLEPERLASAWRDALSDPVCLAADGATARERVITDFSLAAMVRGYERLYLEAGSAG
jgi:glycosyltransferase involved in cell wall biosynthesis